MIVFNFIFIVLRVVGPIVCAMEADKKNRSAGLWGFFGFLFPIIGMICIFSLSTLTKWKKEN